MRGFLLTQAKEALGHGKFTAWVEKELGCHAQTATKLLAVAKLPNPDEVKNSQMTAFDIELNIHELAAAGREVKRGAEPKEASWVGFNSSCVFASGEPRLLCATAPLTLLSREAGSH